MDLASGGVYTMTKQNYLTIANSGSFDGSKPNSKLSFGAAPGGTASLGSRSIGEVRMMSDMRCDPGTMVKKWLQGDQSYIDLKSMITK